MLCDITLLHLLSVNSEIYLVSVSSVYTLSCVSDVELADQGYIRGVVSPCDG